MTLHPTISASMKQWRAAIRWRRRADAQLGALGLTWTDWVVLYSSFSLIRELGDAVNQNQIARRSELTKMAISKALRRLESRSFVSRGPDLIGPGNRIFVTAAGKQALAEGSARLEDAA